MTTVSEITMATWTYVFLYVSTELRSLGGHLYGLFLPNNITIHPQKYQNYTITK